MAAQYGNFVATRVAQARLSIFRDSWTFLSANGTTNHANRQYIELQNKSRSALALQFVNENNTGISVTFTAPTVNEATIGSAIVVPRGAIVTYPIGPGVAVYGRLASKAGSTDASGAVVVVEFS